MGRKFRVDGLKSPLLNDSAKRLVGFLTKNVIKQNSFDDPMIFARYYYRITVAATLRNEHSINYRIAIPN